MRIFLFGWDHTRADYLAVVAGLQKENHEIVYWTTPADENRIDRSRFPSTIFHNVVKASWGQSALGVNAAVFPLPSRELIGQMSQVESMVLTMMNKRFDWMGTDERKHLYYSLLRYWQGVLTEYKPDVIIFIGIPHTVYDYVAYELARSANIKTIMFDDILISDRLLLLNDWSRGSKAVHQALQKNSGVNFTVQDLPGDLKEYYLRQIDKEFDSTPRYVTEDKRKNSRKKVFLKRSKIALASLRDGTIMAKMHGYFSKVFGDNIKKEYSLVQTKADLNAKFIYLPLNYQPECTSSPQGGVFVNQILMIETVAASVPDGWYVYVKEHPVQWLGRGLNFSSSRYKGYYKTIAAIPKVRIVPMTADNYELIRASRAVATLTGTTGLEALLRSKPAIIFGYPWYQDCPFLLSVDGVASCRRAIDEVINGFRVKQPEVINFLKALAEGTIRAYLNSYTEKNSALSPEDNVRNLSRALLKEMEG